jgi:glycine/D-amino acid oxidase-like deaminating enzyme
MGHKDYATYSFWLETCGDDLTPRPSLAGPTTVDVAIVGAGYSGLWTAYYLLRRDPSLQIVILEREIAGFGASGRNGGWCSSGFPLSLDVLAARFGVEAARATQLALYEAVDEIGRVCQQEGIDAHFRKGGILRIARGPQQLPALKQSYATYQQLGLGDHYYLLDAHQTAARISVTKACGALFSPEGAVIHPGRLVRGLARVVERAGATIYEQTAVTAVQAGAVPTLHTTRGEVRAKTVVLAGEAYLTQLKPLHRQLIPIYSLIVLTAPLSAAQWAAIGWQGHECVSSMRYTVDYLSRTLDGRILFGSRGAPYHFGSRIDDAYDRHAPTHQRIKQLVREWFPQLAEVEFTHSWGGPVGMPRDWMPTVCYDRGRGLATARGYTGQGVATSNLAGRILADLILGIASPLTSLPLVGHRSPNWEPEPLRWLGVRYLQWAYQRIDQKAERTGKAPTGRSLAERLGRH